MTTNKSKKQLILEAAARLFRDRGYAATSMRDLARAVDLKASSLYNHISSKEEILQKICFDNARMYLSGMEAVEQADNSASAKIESLIHLHIRMATEEVTSVTAFNDEWRHLGPTHLQQFILLRKEYEARFKAILQSGVNNGEFKSVNPAVALYTILSAIRWVYDWYRPERQVDLPQLKKEMVELLMGGLSKVP